jgi:hypothetical protein
MLDTTKSCDIGYCLLIGAVRSASYEVVSIELSLFGESSERRRQWPKTTN